MWLRDPVFVHDGRVGRNPAWTWETHGGKSNTMRRRSPGSQAYTVWAISGSSLGFESTQTVANIRGSKRKNVALSSG